MTNEIKLKKREDRLFWTKEDVQKAIEETSKFYEDKIKKLLLDNEYFYNDNIYLENKLKVEREKFIKILDEIVARNFKDEYGACIYFSDIEEIKQRIKEE